MRLERPEALRGLSTALKAAWQTIENTPGVGLAATLSVSCPARSSLDQVRPLLDRLSSGSSKGHLGCVLRNCEYSRPNLAAGRPALCLLIAPSGRPSDIALTLQCASGIGQGDSFGVPRDLSHSTTRLLGTNWPDSIAASASASRRASSTASGSISKIDFNVVAAIWHLPVAENRGRIRRGLHQTSDTVAMFTVAVGNGPTLRLICDWSSKPGMP